MHTAIEDVRDWSLAAGTPLATHPDISSATNTALSARLILEECHETVAALRRNDLAGLADGLADTIWVCIEAALRHGIPLAEVWAEVRRTNYAKLVDGEVLRDASGKIQKPPGWTPPDIAGILDKAART